MMMMMTFIFNEEQVLNMDQTICAFAYDNSRARYSKWVGRTNPNSLHLPWPVSLSFELGASAASHRSLSFITQHISSYFPAASAGAAGYAAAATAGRKM